jgi:rod shape-determining protein MreC
MPAYAPESSDIGGRRQLGIAAGFVVLAILVSALPAPVQNTIAAGIRATFLRPFILTQEALTAARIRAIETEALQERVDSLLAVLTNQSMVVRENAELRATLGLRNRLGAEYRAADVVRPGTSGSESMFVVSLGERDGVQLNAPVLDHRGLVGVIREVRPTTAIGIDWTHPDFRASAMAWGIDAFGLLEPSREAFREADRLLLNGAPYNTELPEGTRILTSGLGGVYPRGIPIGVVRGTAEEEAGWRRSYWVEPSVHPGAVTHVLVRTNQLGGTDLTEYWDDQGRLIPITVDGDTVSGAGGGPATGPAGDAPGGAGDSTGGPGGTG